MAEQDKTKAIQDLLDKYADKTDVAADAMDDEENFDEVGDSAGNEEKSGGNKLVIGMAVFALAAIAGGAGYFFMGGAHVPAVQELTAPAMPQPEQAASSETPNIPAPVAQETQGMPPADPVVAIPDANAPQEATSVLAEPTPMDAASTMPSSPEGAVVTSVEEPKIAGVENATAPVPVEVPLPTSTLDAAPAQPAAASAVQTQEAVVTPPPSEPLAEKVDTVPAKKTEAEVKADDAAAHAIENASGKPIPLMDGKEAAKVNSDVMQAAEGGEDVMNASSFETKDVAPVKVKAAKVAHAPDPMDEPLPISKGMVKTLALPGTKPMPMQAADPFAPVGALQPVAAKPVVAADEGLNLGNPTVFLADQAFRMGQYERASTLFGQALQAEPGSAALQNAKQAADAKLGRVAAPAPTPAPALMPAPVPAPVAQPVKPATPVQQPAAKVMPTAPAPKTDAGKSLDVVLPKDAPASARAALTGEKAPAEPVAPVAPKTAPAAPVLADPTAEAAPTPAKMEQPKVPVMAKAKAAAVPAPMPAPASDVHAPTPDQMRAVEMVTAVGDDADGLKDARQVLSKAKAAQAAGRTGQAIALYQKALEVDAVYGDGKSIDRAGVYDALATLRTAPQ